MDYKKIANFVFELNEAKRTPRSGWHRTGIKNAESLAEHSAVCAQIAFLLGEMESVNAEHCALLALFHDIGEIRTGDEDWVSRIYKNKSDSEGKAFSAQSDGLPMGGKLKGFFDEVKKQRTKEAIIAKDADLLELAVQAKFYTQSGYKSATLFIDGMRNKLKTESAKKLLAEIEKSKIEDWWMAIPEIAEIAEKNSGKKCC